MKFVSTQPLTRTLDPDRQYSVGEAVELTCDRNLSETACLIGRLVEELADAGVLSNEQIVRVLSSGKLEPSK